MKKGRREKFGASDCVLAFWVICRLQVIFVAISSTWFMQRKWSAILGNFVGDVNLQPTLETFAWCTNVRA